MSEPSADDRQLSSGATVAITGGWVHDGTGRRPVQADLLIDQGHIVTIGPVGSISTVGTTEIVAEGKIVCPGFVDLHTHSDLSVLSAPDALSKIHQGVTTEVVGNCGLGTAPRATHGDYAGLRSAVGYLDLDPTVEWSWHDVAGYLAAVSRRQVAVNVATLVGHLPLHTRAVGFSAAPPTDAELDQMCGLLADGLDQGAVGLSTGLVYAPLTTVAEPELRCLATVVAKHDKVFSWHVRSYDDGLYESVDQAVRVAEQTGARTQISHLNAIGQRNWPELDRVLERIDTADAQIGIDVYPYLHGNCPLAQLLPAWAQVGPPAQWVPDLQRPKVRADIKAAWRDRPVGWDEIMISFVPGTEQSAVGHSIAALALASGRDGDDIALELLSTFGGGVLIVAGGRSEELLRTVLNHPATVIASDGLAMDPHGPTGAGAPHPRSYGCFPRYLSRYVGASAPDSPALAEAISRCTSSPASIMGIERGVLRPGAMADVLVLDPATLTDRATFDSPQQFAAGIDHVMVNGAAVINNGQPTGARPGVVLRGATAQSPIHRTRTPEESS